MCRQNSDMFSIENVLEIVLAFDDHGLITYDNAAAREKLGYDQGLKGVFIGSVFPGAFHGQQGGWEAVYPFGTEIRRVTVYRKNQTCFPADMRVLRREQEGDYLCMACHATQRKAPLFQCKFPRLQLGEIQNIVNNLIHLSAAALDQLITEKGLDFFVTVSPGVPEYVVGDELRIVQILNNLLSNAQKFTSVSFETTFPDLSDLYRSPCRPPGRTALWNPPSGRFCEALRKNLSKLILSVEMENWEKAEMFMESIRQLTADAPSEVSRAVLRLKMAVQKENYEKISAGTDALQALIETNEGDGV